MAKVILNTVPLTDEAVQELVGRLDLRHLPGLEKWQKLPERVADRYFPVYGALYHWHQGTDHWMRPSREKTDLMHIEVTGLEDEYEAKLLRQRHRRRVYALGQPLELPEMQVLLDEVVAERGERKPKVWFAGALLKIRHYFNPDGSLTEKGRILPLDQLGLREGDVELLRQVFLRLPEPVFDFRSDEEPPDVNLEAAPCEVCGSRGPSKSPRRPRPKGERKTALRTTYRAAREDMGLRGFSDWFRGRLLDFDKPGVWTRASELYEDYAAWAKGKDPEVAAAVMSTTAWGTQMGRVVQHRRDGRGRLYNVRLKLR